MIILETDILFMMQQLTKVGLITIGIADTGLANPRQTSIQLK
jgi:hypothetical protein